MWMYENLGTVLALTFAVGLAFHFAVRWHDRRSYSRLREACVEAVQEARTGDAEAVVRQAELMRDLASTHLPSWFGGLARPLRRWTMICAAVALVTLLARASESRATGHNRSRPGASAAHAQSR